MENTTAGGFIAYPTNRVAGTITDADEAKKAVEDLVAAGFDREAIDVLHGEQDLRRLDPSGGEHGLFAKLQRSLVRGAVGSEFKHLTHHVEDVQAGRFVVMVLAREPRTRDVAAEILYAHGAEFVGFYGRWAYESLPQDSLEAAPADGQDLRHQRWTGNDTDSPWGGRGNRPGYAVVLGHRNTRRRQPLVDFMAPK